ncbi:MAG: hypothetical protein DMF58_01565, partial [Acidobacteria bacterium]
MEKDQCTVAGLGLEEKLGFGPRAYQHIVSNADLFVPAGGSRSAIASNGSEFLGVWTQGLSQFAVRLDAMGRLLDASGIPLRIASSYYGETPLLTGAGGNFILVLAQSVSLLDRDARVLRRVGMGTPGVPLMALSDGRSVLVACSSVSSIFVRLLATDATPITDWTTIGSTFDLSVEREAAFGVDSNGYVAFLATKNGLTMQRISSRGEISPATVLPVDIGGLQRLKTAFDGERHIVVWSTSANPKAVLVTPDGAVSDAFVIPTGSLPSVVLGVDARSGRSFVFFSENRGGLLYELSAVSIDDASRQVGVPFVVAHNVADDLSIANVNDALLLSWPYAGMNGEVLDRPTAVPLGDAFPIARRAAEQNAPSIASGANVDLVVWSEVDTLNTMRVRARRINRAGIPLDPTPIELGTGDPNTIAPTVAYGGGEFLIAWGATQK